MDNAKVELQDTPQAREALEAIFKIAMSHLIEKHEAEFDRLLEDELDRHMVISIVDRDASVTLQTPSLLPITFNIDNFWNKAKSEAA